MPIKKNFCRYRFQTPGLAPGKLPCPQEHQDRPLFYPICCPLSSNYFSAGENQTAFPTLPRREVIGTSPARAERPALTAFTPASPKRGASAPALQHVAAHGAQCCRAPMTNARQMGPFLTSSCCSKHLKNDLCGYRGNCACATCCESTKFHL